MSHAGEYEFGRIDRVLTASLPYRLAQRSKGVRDRAMAPWCGRAALQAGEDSVPACRAPYHFLYVTASLRDIDDDHLDLVEALVQHLSLIHI